MSMSHESSASSRDTAGSTVEQRADRLAAEENGVLRHDAVEGALECRLRVHQVGEPPRLDLAEVGHASGSTRGATIRAVSSVRGSPHSSPHGRT